MDEIRVKNIKYWRNRYFRGKLKKENSVYMNIQLNTEWDLEAYISPCLKIIMFF